MISAHSTAKFLMIALLAANLVVAAAWLARDRLTAYGILPAPEPSRIELEPRPLPAIESPQESSGAEEPSPAMVAAETEPREDPVPKPASQPADEDENDIPPQQALATPASPDPPANTICAIVGPFSERDAAQTAAAEIHAAGGSVEWRPETISAAPVYLVYVAPAANKDAAVATWRALRAQSIEAFIIPSGERRNGISVGVFSEQPRAQAQRQRVAELGHPVQVATMERSATAYRLLANVAPEALVGQPHVPCEP